MKAATGPVMRKHTGSDLLIGGFWLASAANVFAMTWTAFVSNKPTTTDTSGNSNSASSVAQIPENIVKGVVGIGAKEGDKLGNESAQGITQGLGGHYDKKDPSKSTFGIDGPITRGIVKAAGGAWHWLTH